MSSGVDCRGSNEWLPGGWLICGQAGPLALLAAVKDLGEPAERLDGQAVIERAVDDTAANGRIRVVGI